MGRKKKDPWSDLEPWEREEFELFGGPEDADGDDMPSCCRACGGPYPDCMDSCKIFEDD